MKFSWVALGFAAVVAAAPSTTKRDKKYYIRDEGVDYTVFEHAATGAKLSYVTNSGICETTPGVNQYSGYLSVGKCAAMCPSQVAK